MTKVEMVNYIISDGGRRKLRANQVQFNKEQAKKFKVEDIKPLYEQTLRRHTG
jgi:hypothetical protein